MGENIGKCFKGRTEGRRKGRFSCHGVGNAANERNCVRSPSFFPLLFAEWEKRATPAQRKRSTGREHSQDDTQTIRIMIICCFHPLSSSHLRILLVDSSSRHNQPNSPILQYSPLMTPNPGIVTRLCSGSTKKIIMQIKNFW